MGEKILARTDLDRFFDRLRAAGTLFVPAEDADGEATLTDAPHAGAAVLDFTNFRVPPKAFFFPQNQTLIRFRSGRAEEPDQPDRGPRFIFGIRPCDAKALLALDDVFLGGDCRDPYYAERRASTTVIALACERPASTCFCTSVGGGPCDAAGSDVLAVAIEAGFLLSAHTPRGEALLASVPDLLADADAEAVDQASGLRRHAEETIAPLKLDGIAERLRHAWDSPVWETIGRQCLGCGVCSFLCPTCHCFDITDEVRGDRGRRVRTWDSCAYPLFTLHASGHNPRPKPQERCRQRIMHKFRYAQETFGRPFCVGCGRCVRNCPAGLDLRTVISHLGV